MAQLEGMGFPTVRCQKALLATGNADAESAMEWLFAHMEDPGTYLLHELSRWITDVYDVDIDDPIQMTPGAGLGNEAPADLVSNLCDMGFTTAQAKKALRETVRSIHPLAKQY